MLNFNISKVFEVLIFQGISAFINKPFNNFINFYNEMVATPLYVMADNIDKFSIYVQEKKAQKDYKDILQNGYNENNSYHNVEQVIGIQMSDTNKIDNIYKDVILLQNLFSSDNRDNIEKIIKNLNEKVEVFKFDNQAFDLFNKYKNHNINYRFSQDEEKFRKLGEVCDLVKEYDKLNEFETITINDITYTKLDMLNYIQDTILNGFDLERGEKDVVEEYNVTTSEIEEDYNAPKVDAEKEEVVEEYNNVVTPENVRDFFVYHNNLGNFKNSQTYTQQIITALTNTINGKGYDTVKDSNISFSYDIKESDVENIDRLTLKIMDTTHSDINPKITNVIYHFPTELLQNSELILPLIESAVKNDYNKHLSQTIEQEYTIDRRIKIEFEDTKLYDYLKQYGIEVEDYKDILKDYIEEQHRLQVAQLEKDKQANVEKDVNEEIKEFIEQEKEKETTITQEEYHEMAVESIDEAQQLELIEDNEKDLDNDYNNNYEINM